MRVRGDEYRFTEDDAGAFHDDEIAEGAALAALLDAEWFPEDPPTPVGAVMAGHRAQPERTRRWEFRAWAPEGTLAARAECSIEPAHDTNPDLLPVAIFVHSAHRRKGVGTELLGRLVTLANAEGRARLTGWSTSRGPAGASLAAEAVPPRDHCLATASDGHGRSKRPMVRTNGPTRRGSCRGARAASGVRR